MLLVAEILGDRQRGQRHPPACARRLVHLPIDEHRAREHARALHVGQQLVAFAGALADTREDRDALVFLDHGVDQLHHEHGLADAGAAEHRSLAALGQRREQVDHLDAGLEYRAGRGLFLERWRRIVDTAHGVSDGRAGPRSRTVPTTSRRRPRTASPTGTEMGPPVARTGVLRARPAVACSAMLRTVTGSTWLCTSRTSGSGRSHSTIKAVLIGGSVSPSKPRQRRRLEPIRPFPLTLQYPWNVQSRVRFRENADAGSGASS